MFFSQEIRTSSYIFYLYLFLIFSYSQGKISRKLAAKAALAIRSYALAKEDQAHVGIDLMEKMQKQFNNLEGKSAVTNAVKQSPKTEKYENTSKVGGNLLYIEY